MPPNSLMSSTRLTRMLSMSTRLPFIFKFGPFAALFCVVIPLLAISLKLTSIYINSNFSYPVTMGTALQKFGVTESPGVVLLANMYNLDVDGQTLSVHWSIVGACGQEYTNASNDSCIQNSLAKSMDLYLNENATSNWNTTTPVGSYDASILQNPPPVNYISGRSSVPSYDFDSVLPMDPFLPYTKDKKVSTLYYPFDQFQTYVSLLAIDPDDNSTLAITGVVGYGTMVNWIGFDTFYTNNTGDGTVYSVVLTVRRQKMVKAFVIVLILTNWILSLTILWMTILVLFKAQVDTGIILSSTAVLFALPQIRASMPDAPPFGGFIDIGGYFMNVWLVSACTSVLLFSQLRYHYRPLVTTSALPLPTGPYGEIAPSPFDSK